MSLQARLRSSGFLDEIAVADLTGDRRPDIVGVKVAPLKWQSFSCSSTWAWTPGRRVGNDPGVGVLFMQMIQTMSAPIAIPTMPGAMIWITDDFFRDLAPGR